MGTLGRCVAAAAVAGACYGHGAYAAPDWVSYTGFTGALQTPVAFAMPEGSLGFGISSALPYNSLYLSLQPFEWLNFNARYTDITDRPYPGSTTGQSYTDKGFDFSLRLLDGHGALPAVTVGFIDLGGTGLFASEYFVASQRFFDLYASVGMGWGRLGSAGDRGNPLTEISDSFRTRRAVASGLEQTGRFSYSAWFRGEDVALFGSVVWQPSFWPSWSFIAELEGNDYSREPAGDPVAAPSRINYGVAYRFAAGPNVELSYQRGERLAFTVGITPKIASNERSTTAAFLPELTSSLHPAYRPLRRPHLAEQLSDFYYALGYQGFFVHAIDIDDEARTLTVWQSNTVSDDPLYVQRFVARAALNTLPDTLESVKVTTMAGGAGALSVVTARDVLERDARGELTGEEFEYSAQATAGDGWGVDDARFPRLLSYPTYSAGINPSFRTNIGGPTEFVVGQLLLRPYLSLQIARSLSITTSVGVNLFSDFDRVRPIRSGSLPPVRSDLELYQSGGGDLYLDKVAADFIFPLATEWFGRFSAGIFEEMYGGVAGEVLYRPFASRLAVSLDANYVKKRAFDQRFEFLDYEVATGHLGFYYETPWQGITLGLSAGRYLAKDVGATLEMSRGFRNGARFGVFATRTNVSAKDFGEGSFDKGFFVSIPLGAVARELRGNNIGLTYRFLTRDGGQKVNDGRSLYSVFGGYHAGAVYDAQ